MQVHRQHAVHAGGNEHVGDELGGDGVAGLGLAVLTGIAEVRDDRGDSAGRCAAAGIDHDQQLHQAVVDGFAGGLHQKNIAAADGLVQGNRALAVGEALDLRLAELGADDLADLDRQRGVCVAREDFNVLAVRNHDTFAPSVVN